MRTIEMNHIADTSQRVGDAVRQRLGGALYTPSTLRAERSTTIYSGMQRYPKNPDVLLVPTQQNMQALSEGNNGYQPKVFGLMVGKVVRPAVITSRSSAQCLDITYLAPRRSGQAGLDAINPEKPEVKPIWAMLLKQAAAVQDRRVGATHNAAQSVAREAGHALLATAAIKDPRVVQGGHAVHDWTSSRGGIAEAVTGESLGLYDFSLRDGQRATGEFTATITADKANYLLKIPALDRAVEALSELSPADLSVGMGLVALQTQTNATPDALQGQLLARMEAL